MYYKYMWYFTEEEDAQDCWRYLRDQGCKDFGISYNPSSLSWEVGYNV